VRANSHTANQVDLRRNIIAMVFLGLVFGSRLRWRGACQFGLMARCGLRRVCRETASLIFAMAAGPVFCHRSTQLH
jgi:hypothetical protein